MPIALMLLALAAPSSAPGRLYAQRAAPALIAEFGGGSDRWVHVKLDSRSTRFTAVNEDGRPVLRADADRSASAMVHTLNGLKLESATVSWRWRIERAVPDNGREREKIGDDYAARFFVIFDAEPFTPDARALCYVWASKEPVGSSFRNPYAPDVITIVLESGDLRSGRWVGEERDIVADYVRAFGEPPESVSAIAVMADTDDTGTRATAWFGDVRLDPGPDSTRPGQPR